MSRIGRKPIPIPDGVQVSIEKNTAIVRGPKGELHQPFHPDMEVRVEEGQVIVSRPTDSKIHRSLHGLTRTLIANAIEGVTKGFEKQLQIEGVGYRAEAKGNRLTLYMGFSHPVVLAPPEGIQIATEGNLIKVSGIDKELVGKVAARIRAVRPPEPYKGKGIRYVGEHVRHKAGKAGGR
ncbi:MAG: 50S ribosomal protein L6 [candidate division KSB1 bacterium]|nr:50S ribosomal protein L6 [candidate division KSB1 bacterium]